MRDDIFKQKLNEVAECYIEKDYQMDYELRKKIKNLSDESADLVQIDGAHRTYPLAVKRLKIQACQCEDCGQICETGRKTEYKHYKTPASHWRKRCVTCNRWRNPETGEYDLTAATSVYHYNQWAQRQITHEKITQE